MKRLHQAAAAAIAGKDFTAALRASNALVKAAPRSPDAWRQRAQILALGKGDLAGARAALKTALTLAPGDVRARLATADLALLAGDRAAAAETARAVLEDAPDAVSAFAIWAQADPGGVDPTIRERMRATAERADGAPLRERTVLHFALARLDERDGAVAEAFAHYQAGNAASLATRPQSYRPDIEWARHREIVEGVDAALLEAAGAQAHKSTRPIFIVGLPRCGSTWLEQALAAHAKIDAIGEANTLQRAEHALWERLGPTAPPGTRQAERSAPLDRVALLRGLRKTDVQFGANAYLKYSDAFGAAAGGKFVDKTLPNFVRLPLIAALFRDAAIIHLVRDPIDTCWSCYKHHFASLSYTENFETLAHWRKIYLGYMERWSELLGDRILHVSYEAIVDDPARALPPLLERLGVPWDPACAAPHERLRAVERLVLTPSSNQVREPVNRRSVGGWRAFEPQLAPLIEAMGGHDAIAASHAALLARCDAP